MRAPNSNRSDEFTPLFVDFLEHAYMGILEENGETKIQYDFLLD